MNPSLSFSPREWTELYAQRAYDELSERFLSILRHFAESNATVIDAATQRAIDAFVLNFFHLFSKADYALTRRHALEFIDRNGTIANLAALSVLKTTDPYLELLRHQDNSLLKILALYSARNNVQFDRERFFSIDPQAASNWYLTYVGMFHGGLIRREVCRNLQTHFACPPDVFLASDRLPEISYGVSYVDGESEQRIKPAVNRWIRTMLWGTRIRNSPNPKKIAVLSCLWWPGQSSYRITEAFVESLRDYHLTLYHVPMAEKNIDTKYFREVKELTFSNGAMDIGPLLENDYQVAIFPDVGMTSFSLWLSNLRIAPIQVAATGHSVSTWGSEIDYYFGGADVESPHQPDRFYSERLVLLPGCGAIHQIPGYQPKGQLKRCTEFVINCPWSSQKLNHAFCITLAEIVKRSKKQLRFRFFIGGSTRGLNLILFVKELSALLEGAVVEVLPHLNYQQYMSFLEEGDLSIDAYHFGGCNTMADSLYVRKLMVGWEGDRWYNRIGPRMLRMVGLPELIATSATEYVDIVLRLIQDDDYRQELETRLQEADLNTTIFHRGDADYFRKTIDYLIANHETLRAEKDRSPLRINRDSG